MEQFLFEKKNPLRRLQVVDRASHLLELGLRMVVAAAETGELGAGANGERRRDDVCGRSSTPTAMAWRSASGWLSVVASPIRTRKVVKVAESGCGTACASSASSSPMDSRCKENRCM